MSNSIPQRDFEQRRVLCDQASDIAETAGAILSDRTLSHEQRAAVLALMEHAWAVSDALRETRA